MGIESAGGSGNLGGMIGTGLQIAGTLGQTFGAYKKSSGEQTGYEFQSGVAKRNAELERIQASDALVRGATNENTVRHKTKQLKSTQIADLAARNLDISTGSALDILTSTDYMGERDALTTRDNANREAWGHGVQAANFDSNAGFLDWRADQQSPVLDAAGTLLTGAGRVASSWYSMRNSRTGSGTNTA